MPSYKTGFYSPKRRLGIPRYPELWDGCVGAWCPSLGQTGYVLKDMSGYENHGTLTGMDAGTDWVNSGGKLALDFDGTNDTINIPNVDAYGSKDISFGGWVKKVNSTEAGYLIAKNNDGGSSGPGILFGSTIGSLSITSNPSFTTTSGSYVSTEWSHVFVVIMNRIIYVYYNGQLKDTSFTITSIGSSWPNTIPITIGNRSSAATNTVIQLNALIDDLRWYNRALSQKEVNTLSKSRGVAYEYMPRKSYYFFSSSNINTASKRLTISNLTLPFRMISAVPNSISTAGDRKADGYLYSGLDTESSGSSSLFYNIFKPFIFKG